MKKIKITTAKKEQLQKASDMFCRELKIPFCTISYEEDAKSRRKNVRVKYYSGINNIKIENPTTDTKKVYEKLIRGLCHHMDMTYFNLPETKESAEFNKRVTKLQKELLV